MLLMCWISLRNTLYFTLMIMSTLPPIHGAHAHRQHTDMYSVVKRPNILYHQVHHITHRFMPIIVALNSSHEIPVFRVLWDIDEVISSLEYLAVLLL